jgi:hypothetical protein
VDEATQNKDDSSRRGVQKCSHAAVAARHFTLQFRHFGRQRRKTTLSLGHS